MLFTAITQHNHDVDDYIALRWPRPPHSRKCYNGCCLAWSSVVESSASRACEAVGTLGGFINAVDAQHSLTSRLAQQLPSAKYPRIYSVAGSMLPQPAVRSVGIHARTGLLLRLVCASPDTMDGASSTWNRSCRHSIARSAVRQCRECIPEWTGDKLTRLKTVCYMSFRLAKD
eukprot:COSAG02_NODE_72_length_41961_cov_13.243658_10_plen_173_part_00